MSFKRHSLPGCKHSFRCNAIDSGRYRSKLSHPDNLSVRLGYHQRRLGPRRKDYVIRITAQELSSAQSGTGTEVEYTASLCYVILPTTFVSRCSMATKGW